MKKKNLNKTAQGIVSFATIIILLVSVLASSTYFEYSITANAVKETAVYEKPSVQVKEVENIEELDYLNEGWYEIKNGYAYYLESFNDYIPLYIQIMNPHQQNGLMVIYADGTIWFDDSFRGSPRTQIVADEKEDEDLDEESTQNQITGKVTGMERVSGFGTGFNDLIGDVKQGATSKSYQQGTKNFVVTNSKSSKVFIIKDVASEEALRNDIQNSLNAQSLPQELRIYGVSKKELSTIETANPELDARKGLVKLGTLYQGATFYNPQNHKYLDENLKDLIELRSESIQKGTQQLEVSIENYLDSKKSKIEVYAPDGKTLNTLEVPTQLTSTTLQRIKSDYAITYDETKKTITFSKTTNADKQTQKIETIISYEDGKTETTIQEGIGDKFKVTRTVEFADKSQVTKQYKGEERMGNIEKVIITTKEGKKLELGKEQYTNTIGAIASSIDKGVNEADAITDQFLQVAAKEGFTKVEFKEGRLREGSRSILYAQDKDILVFDSDIVTKQITKDGEERIYSGNAIYKNQQVELGPGASWESFKVVDGKTTGKSTALSNDGLNLIETAYEKDKTIIQIREWINNDWSQPTSELTVLGKETSEGPFKGMYKVQRSGSNIPYYYDENLIGGITEKVGLGTGASMYKEGKDVEGNVIKVLATEDFNTAQIYGLSFSITKSREKIEGVPYTVTAEKSQSFFAGVERVFSEFSGLRYYDTLFFDEESLLAWRDGVDRAFATLYLGTEYWSSGLCSQYLDGEDEGIAYAETPQGLAQIGAHVEASRTEQIITDKGREFIYKITFSIRNGDFANDPRAPKEMNFNVILRGETTANVFRQEQKVKRGSTFSRTGKSAIVQESQFFYNQICINFDEIPLRWKLDDKELCNTIVESSGEAVPLTSSAGSTATTTSGGGASENDINDF